MRKKRQECLNSRTPEWMRQEAVARGLRVGRKVKIETLRMDGMEPMRKITRSGEVAGMYPYIFACEIGSITECFRYNQLIGNEEGDRVRIGG